MSDTRWMAEYRCTGCKHEWTSPAGPNVCPDCGHVYITWVNFEALRAANPWHANYPERAR